MLVADTLLQSRYRIRRQVGRGGMGTVYEAEDTRFRSTVAVKEMLLSDKAALTAFRREAKLLYDLRHPALPKVIDYFSEGTSHFLVMDFIPGDDLATLLKRQGKGFPPDKVVPWVLRWGDQLLDALHYLHTQSPPIYHRDIKPRNLKLTRKGDIVLLDFGLAKGGATSIAKTNRSPTQNAQTLMGYTLNYASWEQIRGEEPDPRSDLYSLAATLYHLATGQHPPDALSRASAILNDEADSLQRASVLNTHVPEALADVLHQALSLNPAGRPESAAAMRALLKAVQGAPSNAFETLGTEDTGGLSTIGAASASDMSHAETLPRGMATGMTVQSTNAEVVAQTVNIAASGVISVADPASPRTQTLTSASLHAVITTGRQVGCLAISRDNRLLAAAGDGAIIGVWSMDDGELMQSFEGHREGVNQLLFHPDNDLLVSCSEDSSVRIWSARQRAQMAMVEEQDPVDTVGMSPDGQLLAVGGWGTTISVYRVAEGGSGLALIKTLPAGFVHSVAFSADGSLLAAGCYDTRIYLWHLPEYRLIRTFEGHTNFILTVAFSPDGKRLASGGGETDIRVWRISDGRLIDTLRGHTNFVRSLAFSPDGQVLASGSEDHSVRLWRMRDGATLDMLEGHTDGVTGVIFYNGGEMLASGSRDTKIRLWRFEQE